MGAPCIGSDLIQLGGVEDVPLGAAGVPGLSRHRDPKKTQQMVLKITYTILGGVPYYIDSMQGLETIF